MKSKALIKDWRLHSALKGKKNHKWDKSQGLYEKFLKTEIIAKKIGLAKT